MHDVPRRLLLFLRHGRKNAIKLIGEILKTISRNVLKNGRNCDKIDNIYKTLRTLGSKSRRGYSGLTEQSGAGLPAEKKMHAEGTNACEYAVEMIGITKRFPGIVANDNIALQLKKGEIHALLGENGAGKSTLLKILAGVRTATRGQVSAPKDTVMAYLPQHLMTEDGRTVFEEASQAFAHLHEMEAHIETLNKQLAERTDYESEEYMALIEEVATLSEKFYAIDMTHFEEDVEKTLLGLGFERSDFCRQTSEFSGGWRMRIELAKMLLQKPDVLLLDEPTNHLDLRTKDVLKQALADFDGTLICVSHDRDFLDGLVNKVYEFGHGRVREHLCGIYEFLDSKKAEELQRMGIRA